MLVSIAQAQIFILALTRILAVLVHVPVLSGDSVPLTTRILLGVTLAIILTPGAALPADAASMNMMVFGIALVKEIFFGTLTGFAASLTFGAVLIASEVMGLQSGFSSGRTLNPTTGENGSAYNQLFVMVAMLYFLMINGHHWVIEAIGRSFVAFPINSNLAPGSVDVLLHMSSQLLAAGVQLALPVFCALFLTDLTLGLISRVAPQVQVFFLGMPLKVGVALIALSMSLPMMLPLLYNLYSGLPSRMLSLLPLGK